MYTDKPKIIVISVLVFLLVLVMFALYWRRNKSEENEWKLQYLKGIYPLAKNLTSSHYDELEVLFSDLLPNSEKNRLKKLAYKSNLPGPSCGEVPCSCDKNLVPQVEFSPNPILQNAWPPCNVPGANGKKCCSSVKSYKDCFKAGKISWVTDSTWEGNEANMNQKPPKVGQVWKPNLWPNYSLQVTKYPPNNPWKFYNVKGNMSNSWIEVVHSAFSTENVTYGVWFYRTIGSGIFLNLNNTYRAKNKITAIFDLWQSMGVVDYMGALADFILRPVDDKVNVVFDGPDKTGVGGPSNLVYWIFGMYSTNMQKYIDEKYAGSGMSLRDKIITVLKEISYLKDIFVDRMNNTGALDSLVTWLAFQQGYNSIQFTVQPNLYTGWTTEVMYIGENGRIFTKLSDVSRDDLRLLDPADLNSDNILINTDTGKPCTYKDMTKCLYCDEIPMTKNSGMNCTVDILPIEATCDPKQQP